jgi:hypothetical protein
MINYHDKIKDPKDWNGVLSNTYLRNGAFLGALSANFSLQVCDDFEVVPTMAHQLGMIFLDVHSRKVKNLRFGIAVRQSTTTKDTMLIETGLIEHTPTEHWIRSVEPNATILLTAVNGDWAAEIDMIIEAVFESMRRIGMGCLRKQIKNPI